VFGPADDQLAADGFVVKDGHFVPVTEPSISMSSATRTASISSAALETLTLATVVPVRLQSPGALSVRDVRLQLGQVLMRDERLLLGVHAPALDKAAKVYCGPWELLSTTSYPCAVAALARLLPTWPLPMIPIVVMSANSSRESPESGFTRLL
jgi:hypothetical protein